MRLALPLVLASQLTAPSAVSAVETGTLTGRVLPPTDGGVAARAVWIGGVSTPVGPAGWFRATGIAGGPHRLAVETEEGLYVVESPVSVAPGTTSSLQVALRAREDSSAPATPEKEKTKKPTGIWANPAAATLIIVGSAIVVGLAVDQWLNPNDEASPFVPSSTSN